MRFLILALVPFLLCESVAPESGPWDGRVTAVASEDSAGTMSSKLHRLRRNGPPRYIPVSRPVYVLRPVLRPLPPRPYPARPGTRIPYLPFFRVMNPPPAEQNQTTGAQVHADDKSKTKKLLVKSGLDNKSEAEVEVLPVTLVVDMDVLATGVLDLVNTLDETGLLPDGDDARDFRAMLQNAKEGERQVFEVDPSSMNVIFAELMKSQIKQ